MNFDRRIAWLLAFLCAAAPALAQQATNPAAQPSEPSQTISKQELDQSEIRKVQSALNEAGYNAGSVDGVWGKATDRALRDFQQAKGLDASGQLDQPTVLALGFARDELGSAQPVLNQADVRQVQEALNKSGYNVGSVDGNWGQATESALRDFQKAKGLEPTGQLDQETVLALGLSPAEFAAGEFQEQKKTDEKQ